MIIKTAEDWWTALTSRWPDILQCFSNAGADLGSPWWSDGPGCEVTEHGAPMLVLLERAKLAGDFVFLRRMLGLLWMAAPDSPVIHTWPSWHVVCDLCSEDWVLEPERTI